MRRIQESVAQLRQATANSLFKFGGNAVVELVKRVGGPPSAIAQVAMCGRQYVLAAPIAAAALLVEPSRYGPFAQAPIPTARLMGQHLNTVPPLRCAPPAAGGVPDQAAVPPPAHRASGVLPQPRRQQVSPVCVVCFWSTLCLNTTRIFAPDFVPGVTALCHAPLLAIG